MTDFTRGSHILGMSMPGNNASFVGNRSYISTSFASETDHYEMRKSRIQNIPNYKKLSLGDNVPFVVVFQAIEIERLSTEIESNRIKIKDFERQMFNSQNYQVQIRELTEKLFSLDQEKAKYSDEVEKLNLICHQLYSQLEDMKKKYREVDFTLKDKYDMERVHSDELRQEIERWKVRYMAAEKSKAKELDDLRLMMESQRKSMFDREIREITIRFQTERSTLENEIRKLREALEYKNRELEEGRGKLQRLEIQVLEMQSSLGQMTEYENQLAMLSQEMLRLNELIKAKQYQLEESRQKEFSLSQKLKEQAQWQHELKNLRSSLDNRTREIEDWRIRYSKLEEMLAKHQDLINVNNDLKSQLGMYEQEIHKYEVIVTNISSENDEWKRKIANQDSELNRLRNQSADLVNYQNKVGVLSSEIERLNLVMRTKISELEEWRTRHNKLQVVINNYSNIERDNQELQNRLTGQTRAVEEHKHRIIMLQQELNNISNLERMLSEANSKTLLLNDEIRRLNDVLRSKSQEVDDYRIRYTKMETELRDFRGAEAQLREYENQLALVTQEVQRINNLARAKTQEIERLNTTIRRLQQENAHLKTNERKMAESERTIQNLSIKIENHIRETQKWEDKCKILDMKAKEYDTSLFNINQDRDKLSQQLKAKMFEYDELRTKFMRVETEAYKTKELQVAYNDMKSRLNSVTTELERVDRIAREAEAELDRERGLSTELSFKVIILSAEIERVTKSGGGIKGAQYKELQERFSQLQSASNQKDQQISLIMQKISTLEQQIIFLGGELQKFLGAIGNYEQHAIALEQEVLKYQDYAKRIMILSAEIDRLQGQNRGLEQDIKRMRLRYADQIAGETKHQSICLTFVLLSAQIDSLRSRMSQKEVQLDQMRKSILDPVRNIHQHMN